MVHLELPDLQEMLALLVPQVLKVNLVFLDFVVNLDHLALKDSQVLKAPLVQEVMLDHREAQVLLELLAQLVMLELLELPEHPDLVVTLVFLVLLDHKALLDQLVHQGSQDLLVHEDSLVKQDHKVILDRKDPMDLEAI